MNTLSRWLASTILALAVATSTAQAQRPQSVRPPPEKPWPRVSFQEFFDGKSIATFGQTRGEGGDIPIDMRGANDGSGRIFLAERLGKILIFKDGKLLPEPFLDLGVQNTDQERGLLSIAFPPDFKTKGHFYTYRTDPTRGATLGDVLIERYQVDPKNPNHALAESAELILRVHHPRVNHNGGQLQFGKDGMLYFGIGDGGAGNDPDRAGQNLAVLPAKMLRIDVESKPDQGLAYHIPADNPFVKTPGARGEIWALGLRNPFRFSFDSANGDMYIGNVGQDHWEMIYYSPVTDKGGDNYGWSIYEGTHNDSPGLPKGQTKAPGGDIIFPVAEFTHNQPIHFISICGGYVYRGKEFPNWDGVYFFSDWGNSQLWAMRRNADGIWETHRVDNNQSPVKQTVSFGIDDSGSLYLLSFADGKIYKLIETPAAQ